MGPAAQIPVTIIEGRVPSLQAVAQALAPAFEVKVLSESRLDELPAQTPCVVDRGSLSADAWRQLKSSRPEGKGLVVVGGPDLRESMAELLGESRVRHILGRLPDTSVPSPDLEVTLRRMAGQKNQGVTPYLTSPEDTFRRSIRRSTEKNGIASEATRFARRAKMNPRLAYAFATVADEFVTNSFYNAPTDATGTHKYAHLQRTVEVNLEQSEAVTVEMAFDGRRIGISVTDPFGSLTVERFQESMARCLRKGKDQVNMRDGGAGIGIFYAFELVSHLIVDITPGSRTEMIGLIDGSSGYRDWASRSKSLNVFSDEEV